MNPIRVLMSNGLIPLLPILLWNILLADKLPAAYQPGSFDSNIPVLLLIGESLSRFLVFFLAIFSKIHLTDRTGRRGLLLFLLGNAFYFASWILLMYAPDSNWSRSAAGFTAPASTPLLWLIGLGLMFDSYYFRVPFSRWYYIFLSFVFIAFHFSHAWIVFLRTR